jgi:hypothetical protein
MSMGSVTRVASADDTYETWPKKTAEPIIEKKPATDADGAAKDWETWPKKTAGPVLEQKPAKGRSYRTIGWIALGIAAVIGIGIAVAAGGGGDGGGVVTNPGHQ